MTGGDARGAIDARATWRLRDRSPVGRWTLGIAVGLLVCIGAALRLWALGRHAINSDEAVVALMAERILHGHLSAFYWGQSYGGGEPYAVALVFALFGQSTFSLGLTPVLLDAGAAILVWRIGRRLLGPQLGLEAALLFWVWPETYVWQSTIEYGFRWFVLDLGLSALLVTLRITARDARWPRWEMTLLGLLLGLGWWGSPEIAYFAIPIAVYWIYCSRTEHLRVDIVGWLLAVLGALVGAAAWLEVNLRQSFVSLHSTVQPDPGFGRHLKIFLQHAVPLLLGTQLRMTGRWLLGLTLGNIVNDAGLVACAVLLVLLARRREALALVALLLVAPFIYAASPFTWYWTDGRYGLFLAPAVALAVVAGMHELLELPVCRRLAPHGRELVGAAVLVCLALGSTLYAASQLGPYHPNGVVATGSATWTSWRADPSSGMSAVASTLERDRIFDVYAGYWVAYPLMFASRSAITSSDIAYVRQPAFLEALARDPTSAYLFVNPHQVRLGVALTGVSLMDPSCAALTDRCLTPGEFTRYLVAHRIAYRSYAASPFVAIVPARAVSNMALSRTFGLRPAHALPS